MSTNVETSAVDRHDDAGAIDPTHGESAPRRLASSWLIRPDIDQEPALAVPAALAVDQSRERIFLLELQPPEVRLYSALDGRFLARLGREGGGPGEFRAPMSMAVNRSGDLAVVAIDGRTTFWSADGRHRGVSRVGSGLATRIVTVAADSFMVKLDRLPPADLSEYHVLAFGEGSAGVRFTDAAISGLEKPAAAMRNHAYAVAGNALGELLLALPGPRYRILRISAQGIPVQEILRPEIPPLVRSEREIAELRSRIKRSFQAVGRGAPGEIAVPAQRSHIAALAVASDGGIWALTKRGHDNTSIIDRFDSRGRFLVSYEVELRVIDLAVTEGRLYLLGLDAQEMPGVAIAGRPDPPTGAARGTGGGL